MNRENTTQPDRSIIRSGHAVMKSGREAKMSHTPKKLHMKLHVRRSGLFSVAFTFSDGTDNHVTRVSSRDMLSYVNEDALFSVNFSLQRDVSRRQIRHHARSYGKEKLRLSKTRINGRALSRTTKWPELRKVRQSRG